MQQRPAADGGEGHLLRRSKTERLKHAREFVLGHVPPSLVLLLGGGGDLIACFAYLNKVHAQRRRATSEPGDPLRRDRRDRREAEIGERERGRENRGSFGFSHGLSVPPSNGTIGNLASPLRPDIIVVHRVSARVLAIRFKLWVRPRDGQGSFRTCSPATILQKKCRKFRKFRISTSCSAGSKIKAQKERRFVLRMYLAAGDGVTFKLCTLGAPPSPVFEENGETAQLSAQSHLAGSTALTVGGFDNRDAATAGAPIDGRTRISF